MTPTQEAAEREAFEADAGPYGFDLTRTKQNLTGEPWGDYVEPGTAHRWGGWLAARATLSQQGGGAVAPGYKVVPVEPDHASISAMACSQALDDEGEFPALMDLIDYSGENKTRTVLAAAYRAAIAAAPPAPQEAREPLTDECKEKIAEAREILDETYRFAATSPRSQQNINAVLSLLDEIESAVIAATAKGERG